MTRHKKEKYPGLQRALANFALNAQMAARTQNGDGAAESVLCARVCECLSIVTVQRAFGRQYESKPPSHQSILRWYKLFQIQISQT